MAMNAVLKNYILCVSFVCCCCQMSFDDTDNDFNDMVLDILKPRSLTAAAPHDSFTFTSAHQKSRQNTKSFHHGDDGSIHHLNQQRPPSPHSRRPPHRQSSTPPRNTPHRSTLSPANQFSQLWRCRGRR